MSQLIYSKPHESKIYQDLVFQEKKLCLLTHVDEATCFICQKSLGDGYNLTAKNTPSGILLYCEKHF